MVHWNLFKQDIWYYLLKLKLQFIQGVSGRGLSEAVYRASNDVTPQFPLDALSPGRYTFLVYSETPRGRSQHPAALHSIPIRTSEDLDVPGKELQRRFDFNQVLKKLTVTATI